MSRLIRDFDNIRDILLASIGNRVTIILSSGRVLRMTVESVVDDLLIASINSRIIAINIDRIDAVVTCCRQLFGAIIESRQSQESNFHYENSGSRQFIEFGDNGNRNTSSGILGDDTSRNFGYIRRDGTSDRYFY